MVSLFSSKFLTLCRKRDIIQTKIITISGGNK